MNHIESPQTGDQAIEREIVANNHYESSVASDGVKEKLSSVVVADNPEPSSMPTLIGPTDC